MPIAVRFGENLANDGVHAIQHQLIWRNAASRRISVSRHRKPTKRAYRCRLGRPVDEVPILIGEDLYPPSLDPTLGDGSPSWLRMNSTTRGEESEGYAKRWSNCRAQFGVLLEPRAERSVNDTSHCLLATAALTAIDSGLAVVNRELSVRRE